MTLDDAVKTLIDLFPDMDWGENNDGQIVIYTGMKLAGRDNLPPVLDALVPMDEFSTSG